MNLGEEKEVSLIFNIIFDAILNYLGEGIQQGFEDMGKKVCGVVRAKNADLRVIIGIEAIKKV